MEDRERKQFSPLLDDDLGPGAPVTPEVRVGRNDPAHALPDCVRCNRPAALHLHAVWLSTRAVLAGDTDVDHLIQVDACGACAGSVAGMILINWDPRYWGESVNLD
ncbi:hypothetical protein ACIP5Y_13230 [Nocardia sp. NPDC088792]|uniref:hypothetical protein n=1 Tax=Nocardia sp. NPDC088792 TaxID=3364332 RepID=UPI003811BEF5